MKELPLLCNGPVVRAILEDRKSKTRRLVKGVPKGTTSIKYYEVSRTWIAYEFDEELGFNLVLGSFKCPYGMPGDRLWVRETHALESWTHEYGPTPPQRADRPVRVGNEENGWVWLYPHYRATDPVPELSYEDQEDPGQPHCRWSPSIHMPRWASRILLEVVNVRVERLQEIDWRDAIAEGIKDPRRAAKRIDRKEGCVAQFRELWESIYGAGSWEANPWVWVVEFKRVKGVEGIG